MQLALLLDQLSGVGGLLVLMLLYFASIPLMLFLLFRTMRRQAATKSSLYLIYILCAAVLLGGWLLEASVAELLPFAVLPILAMIVHLAKR